MLGLGSNPYGGLGSLGPHSAVQSGGWQTSTLDFETELTNLKTSIDTTQRALSQLEHKFGGRLEHMCRRQIDDTLASCGPLQEMKKELTRLQHECRHCSLEAGRKPTAREVDEALERHKGALEERLTERLDTLERNVSQQHQNALERLEGRGGETWRVCLQRMASLEEKVVLQSDTKRLIEHALNEVKRAGPEELFGPAGTVPIADLRTLKTLYRRLETKVAGCEARVLGLAEDNNAGWRAIMGAKLETLERSFQDLSGHLAGCVTEADIKASEGNLRASLDLVQTLASDAHKRSEDAHLHASDAKDGALKHEQALKSLAGLEQRAQDRMDTHRREVSNLKTHLQDLAISSFNTRFDELSGKITTVEANTQDAAEQQLQSAIVSMRQETKATLAQSTEQLQSDLNQLVGKIGNSQGRLVDCDERILALSEKVAKMEARVRAPGKAMDQMAKSGLSVMSALSGLDIGTHLQKEHVTQGPGFADSLSSTLAAQSSAKPSISQPSWLANPADVPLQTPAYAASSAGPDGPTEDPPIYSFDHAADRRPPRIPDSPSDHQIPPRGSPDRSPSVLERSFGEPSRVEHHTSASHIPSMSPGEVRGEASLSAVMSATPSHVPGLAMGEETGVAPCELGLSEDANSWDDDSNHPPAEGHLSPPTLAPMQSGESDVGSNLSVPLPDSEPSAPHPSVEERQIVTQPQSTTASPPRAQPVPSVEHPVAPSMQPDAQSGADPRASAFGYSEPPPPPARTASMTGSVDTAAAMQIAAEFDSPTHSPEAKAELAGSEWDISGSLEGSAALQAAAASASAFATSPSMTEPLPHPVANAFRSGQKPPTALVPPEAELECSWDASGSLEGNAAMQAAALAAVAEVAKAKAPAPGRIGIPIVTPAPHEQPVHQQELEPEPDAGSDWDASQSMEGAHGVAMQAAVMAAPGRAAGHVAEHSDEWDASGSLEGGAAHAAAPPPTGSNREQSSAQSSTMPARPADPAAPAVGLAGAQSRFSSMDALQEGNSFDDDEAVPGFDESNSFDSPKGHSRRTPGKQPVLAPQPAAQPQPVAMATPAVQVPYGANATTVSPRTGAVAAAASTPSPKAPGSARQALADLGFDSDADVDDEDEDLDPELP
jgi:hypothetical protein